jgi:TolB protein
MKSTPIKILLATTLLSACMMAPKFGVLGIFTDQADIGTVSKPGTAAFDPSLGTYTVGASGANMWFAEDDMHFVFKQASGDLSLAADIAFLGDSKQGHRKGCLMIRQSMDKGSPMVDVAVHGDGLTAIQFRDLQGGRTREIQSMMAKPERVRLDKMGDTVYLSVAAAGEEPHSSGASHVLHFTDPFYIGLAVSAHDNAAFETVVFSKVDEGLALPAASKPAPGLHVITLPSGDERVTDH